jgi:hypothetical protein
MNNNVVKKLAMDLLHADYESDVINILKNAGLWDSPKSWRLLGDDENNFKTVGAQQARSEPALVEKLINSVDARFTSACLQADIDPTSAEAPQTIHEAKKRFFDNVSRTDLAKGITLAITGARAQQDGMPSITISDIGEGQTPSDVPNTFMSIDKKNKLRIPFVQGKFNMGGTGALMFCGRHKLQLLITRRNPKIRRIQGHNPKDSHWSITVVRRETPPEGPGQVRNPYYKYLAPLGADVNPSKGHVLTFEADSLNLMPEGNIAYSRPMEWGSCIKLYEYDMRGFKGHILRTDGLLSRMEILLPEVELPIRFHECREGFRGHIASHDTNLVGLRERLESSRGESPLEPGYPASLTLNVQGQPLTARIYAFKGDNADRYRADQGVVFTLNGQTHGWFPKSFFERKRVKMGRLAKALLVVVDATDISVDARADLFKNSRDRLSGGALRRDIEDELESQIANHPGLRELRERRRREEVTEKLSEAKPLEDVLRAIIKTSPSLSKLFLMGQRLSSPYRSGEGGQTGGGGGGGLDGKAQYNGKKHPSYFRFEKLKDGEPLKKSCEHGRRCRLRFLTDVENEYFIRDSDRGRYSVEVIDGALKGRELTNSVNLFNGIANWSVAIPEEDVEVGDNLTLQFSIEDGVISPIINTAQIVIEAKTKREGGGSGTKRERAGGDTINSEGVGSEKGNKDNKSDGPPTGIQLPKIHKVRRSGWAERNFDEHAACTAIDEGTGQEGDERSVYEFYINVDNLYLQTDIKQSGGDPAIVEAKFIYGNVLIGLALIHDQLRLDSSRKKSEELSNVENEPSIVTRIENVTRALSPFLVPMVEYLGGLESEEVSQLSQAGDEV